MRKSRALCVSIMHCDLAVILRRTAALSVQMLSTLCPARSDGFKSSSGFRKTEHCAILCFITFFSLIQERENVMEVLQTLTWDTVTGIIGKMRNLTYLTCCKKNLRWKKYLPSYQKQPLDEMPLPFTIRGLELFFFFFTSTCETSIWLPDIWSRKSWHPQTIRSPAQSLVTHSVWAAGPLHPHHKSSLHHKLSN